MTRLWSSGEIIRVVRDIHHQPLRFVWQGQTHAVEQIEQMWEVDSDWWAEEGRVWRDYFAVTTDNGLLCVLYCDKLDNRWRLAKVYD